MASRSKAPITFVVAGTPQSRVEAEALRGAAAPELPAGLRRGTIKQAVRVGAAVRGGGKTRLTAQPGEDVVVLQVHGGPALVLHPANARDLLLAQSGAPRARGKRAAQSDEVVVAGQLQWAGLAPQAAARGAARAGAGDVLLTSIAVVTGIGKDPAADFAASEIVRRVDAQVNPGVYALASNALPKLKDAQEPLARLPAAADGAPLLVFVHGTFSETSGTFGKLWLHHPDLVAALFKRYGGRVYGLDHPTLGASPIENALTLARVCPKGARLHLVTHSRGGLVAETLARVCGNPRIGARDLAAFKGEDYVTQRDHLKALAKVVAERDLQVDRTMRVACPSRGTLLASKRLDAYVSVLKWALELAGVPVAPAIVDFLGEVARRRADPTLIPGLAAQIPDSPLIRWIHDVDAPIPGDLRIVAGDIEGDSVVSWLKTLLADAFFWTDNDLVVQTRSMYGGAPREKGAAFVFDQGGKVSHFNYFFNDRTAGAVVEGLTQEAAPPAFREVGPLSWAGKSATGFRAARGARPAAAQPDRPAVFVLPGILGSNLAVDGKRVWLSWRIINGLSRLAYKPGDDVAPDGAIASSYDRLEEYLAATHEVVEFAFDWRVPMEQEARRLADAVDAALEARKSSGKPVRIVAHSMGGLLARTMQLERPATWERMMAGDGARVLMLGTPNGGSWSPMQVLSGDDTYGNALVAFGAPFQDHAARMLMAAMPGFIQLQASLADPAMGLAREATWQKLADQDLASVQEFNSWHRDEIQLSVYRWGVPPQAALDQALALRKRLDAQRDGALAPYKDRMLLVAGKARVTPDGFEMTERGLTYLDAPDSGDGRVPIESARISGIKTWQADCAHGDLSSFGSAFPAYAELLASGETELLPQMPDVAAATRAAAAADTRVPSRPSRMPSSSQPPASESDVVAARGTPPRAPRTASGTALSISVIHGDLMFVRQPLLLGHYRSLRLTGTENVVDGLLGHAMSTSLAVGNYPDRPGTHEIFLNRSVYRDNPLQLPRPQAAIVVGLGVESTITANDLVDSVRQGVAAWSRRLTEMPEGAPAVFELASTLLGSGGVRITVGESARLIAQGVREANARLADAGLPVVAHLYLIELYLDRAGDVWRALQVQVAAAPADYEVREPVKPGIGGLPRLLDSGYRGAAYDFVSAATIQGPHGETQIAYTLDTKRARSEVQAQQTQVALVRNLLAAASADDTVDTEIGRTLFRLLVPIEMEPFLSGTMDMQLEVDEGTAGIPWELLDNGAPTGPGARPWAIRAKLIRKFRMSDYRPRVIDADAESSVLVIGEPAVDLRIYPALPGARREAAAVAQCLAGAARRPQRVIELFRRDPQEPGFDANTIVKTLLGHDWRIVHIAGHGEPPLSSAKPRGVVLSDGTFLGPDEIARMRVVPELVFVNCCYLSARDPAQLLAGGGARTARSDRARFAATVAESLIKIGVRCVIAAGWPVSDDAARAFAARFYEALLRGERFIDAAAEARGVAFDLGGNTWAAYQCYGDADWRFVPGAADAQAPATSPTDEFAGVAAAKTLVVALETLAIRSKFQKAPRESQQAKIRYLEATYGARWGGIGEVAEAFGRAWSEAGDQDAGARWYARALDAGDGTASMRVIEQLGNLRARRAVAKLELELAKPKAAGAKAGASARNRAREEIDAALALLERVTDLQPTVERESLCGSAWKRLAMVEMQAGNATAAQRAIENMKARYGRAVKIARATGSDELFYPALNFMAAALVAGAGKRSFIGFDRALRAEVRANLEAKARDDPDFWSVAGLTELAAYDAVAKGKLADAIDGILRDHADLHARVSAAWLWSSLLDQARFAFSRYTEYAPAAERKAVAALVRRLRDYATMPPMDTSI